MKKRLIEYTIAAVVIGAIIYWLAAFMAWDVNPGRWGETARIIAGVWFLTITGIYTLNREIQL